MFSQRLYRVLLLLGLLAALTGCAEIYDGSGGSAGTSSAKASVKELKGEPVKIGVLLPLSGEGASYGIPAQRVDQIATKIINEQGGIGGRPLELVFEDGKCDSTEANKAIGALVSVRQVKFVHGGFCSSETLAAAPIAEENKVILISSASSNPKISQAGDFIFRNYPSDSAQGQALADYAKKKGYKAVGIITEEQPYTEGIADAFTGVFTQSGGKVQVEKYASNASDFRTQITKLQVFKAEAFFVNPQTPAKADLVVKQLIEAGVKGPYILNDVALGATKEVIEKYKAAVEGSVGAEVPYDKNHPELVKLKEEYKKLSNGEEVPYLSYMAPTYDALFILKEAIEKEGDDPVKVKNYLYTVKGRKGLAGTLSFDANGDPTSDYRHALRMVKNGVVENYQE
ncbi:ABC transporter substrate-binding protein [Candidatus Peregrinibacteria bacterium]|nr:ABC transporter substrate-binding protein [Candidatus Peregrinibacteria bacterium]